MTKYRKHPWPTDGATRKYVDRITDRHDRRLDGHSNMLGRLKERILLIEEFLSLSPHASAFEAFINQKKKK